MKAVRSSSTSHSRASAGAGGSTARSRSCSSSSAGGAPPRSPVPAAEHDCGVEAVGVFVPSPTPPADESLSPRPFPEEVPAEEAARLGWHGKKKRGKRGKKKRREETPPPPPRRGASLVCVVAGGCTVAVS